MQKTASTQSLPFFMLIEGEESAGINRGLSKRPQGGDTGTVTSLHRTECCWDSVLIESGTPSGAILKVLQASDIKTTAEYTEHSRLG